MCFETTPTTPTHAVPGPEQVIPVMIAQTECVIDLNHLVACLDDPARRHEAPRVMRALQQHHAALFHTIAVAMPDAYKAFRAGLDSTNDLHAAEKAQVRAIALRTGAAADEVAATLRNAGLL